MKLYVGVSLWHIHTNRTFYFIIKANSYKIEIIKSVTIYVTLNKEERLMKAWFNAVCSFIVNSIKNHVCAAVYPVMMCRLYGRRSGSFLAPVFKNKVSVEPHSSDVFKYFIWLSVRALVWTQQTIIKQGVKPGKDNHWFPCIEHIKRKITELNVQ